MAWKQIEKPRTVLASASLVKEFTEMEPAPHDRPLSERRLQVYERILNNGEFRPVTWASVLCRETGTTYRVNGKHTSLLLSLRKPIPEFHVTVERYAADTLTDVANLYNTFDSSVASRSARDVNAAFAATVPALRDIPLRTITTCVTALALNKWPAAELRAVSQAERAEELLDNQDFVEWVAGVVPSTQGSVNHTRHLGRVPVVRAMLVTFRKNKAGADKFWRAVRDESAPDRDDPTRVLARYLVRSVIAGGSGRGMAANKKLVDSRELYVKCLHGWNAWRSGESTNLNYYPRAADPKVV